MKKMVGVGIVIVLIIVGVLVYFSYSYNYSFNLNKKFGQTGKVIDYGKYNVNSYEEFITKANELYIKEKEKGNKIYLVTGDKNGVSVSNYEDIALGRVGLVVGENQQKLDIAKENLFVQRIKPEGDEVIISLNNKDYTFKLKTDEKIYFIVIENEK